MTQNIQQTVSQHPRISRRRRAVLPHLGNFFFGKLYHAVTGARRLPPALFKRAVANGIDRELLDVLYKQARSVEALHSLLLAVSENCLQKAAYWDEIGVKTRARDHYLESALWGIHAAALLADSTVKSQLLERSKAVYARGTAYFSYPAQLVEIPYSLSSFKGYLRLPAGAGRTNGIAEGNNDSPSAPVINLNYPCVLLFNGFGLPTEELHLTENAMLSAGMATLSFDYPDGKFDTNANTMFAFDVSELADALFLFLSSRREIDTSRVALYGTSIGGRIALSAAVAHPGRFRSVCTLSAPLDLSTDLDLLLSALQRELAVSSTCNKGMLVDLARRTPLRSQLEQLQTPALVVGGGKDVIAMPEETRAIYELCGSTDKKLVICPSAGHNCYEMMPSLRHEIAQWLRQRM